MANSITGINDDIIASAVLRGFTKKIAPLGAFATDFSSDAAKAGDTISVLRDDTAIDTPVIKVTHTDYTIQDADSDAVEISLGQPYYVSWGLDDVEIASSSVLNMEVYGERKGNRLAEYVMAGTGSANGILNVITNANYGAAAFTGAASTFDSDDVADIKDSCDDSDWPEENRWLILSNAYMTNLIKDGDIKSSDAFGSPEVVRQGMVPSLYGFNVISSNIIPANGENLVGFAARGEAIAAAFRYLQPQDGNTYNRAERLVGDGGVTLGLRDWYDNDSGVRKRVVECVWGSVAGITDGIKRIVSA